MARACRFNRIQAYKRLRAEVQEIPVKTVPSPHSQRKSLEKNMKRKMLTILGLLVLVSAPLFANGGIHWWINGSGTNPSVITLKNDSDIILKKENLVLRFVDDCVIVSCDYVLFNKSNAEKQIDFAFNITDSAYDSLKYYDIFVNDLKVDSELHKDVI